VSPARRRSRGVALFEVVISVMLLSMAASGVFGALLVASRQTASGPDREQATLQVEALLDELRNFVTADSGAGPDAPGTAAGAVRTWKIAGDSCGCWALAEGTHDVTERLPENLRLDRGARMSYTVAVVTVNGLAVRRVHARLDWASPP
jgi:Tfp pilus assembly protein PilV